MFLVMMEVQNRMGMLSCLVVLNHMINYGKANHANRPEQKVKLN